jgi:hypothetical protein
MRAPTLGDRLRDASTTVTTMAIHDHPPGRRYPHRDTIAVTALIAALVMIAVLAVVFVLKSGRGISAHDTAYPPAVIATPAPAIHVTPPPPETTTGHILPRTAPPAATETSR